MDDLPDGVVIKILKRLADNDTLVLAERHGNDDGRKSKRVKPVIWANVGSWREIPGKIVNEYKPFGFYLVAIPWNLRGASTLNGQEFHENHFHVLHCVRKEMPVPEFGGRVGPLSGFAPREKQCGEFINGYYVGYHCNGEESLEEIPKHFNGKFTMKGRKYVNKINFDPENTVQRLGVMMGKDSYCVGMEVRLSYDEESSMRKKGEYHHTRPIILENGFYIFDGILKLRPIYSTTGEPIPFPYDVISPIIFLGDGVHLITSTKKCGGNTNGERYKRIVKISPSLESEEICVFDWEKFEDLLFHNIYSI